jgi:hypothetical protein
MGWGKLGKEAGFSASAAKAPLPVEMTMWSADGLILSKKRRHERSLFVPGGQ